MVLLVLAAPPVVPAVGGLQTEAVEEADRPCLAAVVVVVAHPCLVAVAGVEVRPCRAGKGVAAVHHPCPVVGAVVVDPVPCRHHRRCTCPGAEAVACPDWPRLFSAPRILCSIHSTPGQICSSPRQWQVINLNC